MIISRSDGICGPCYGLSLGADGGDLVADGGDLVGLDHHNCFEFIVVVYHKFSRLMEKIWMQKYQLIPILSSTEYQDIHIIKTLLL